MPGSPLSVFVSAHEDEAHRAALSTQLSLLRRSGMIREWHDRKLKPASGGARRSSPS